MARKKVTISLQDVLQERYDEWEKERTELDSDLKELFNKLNGHELADAIIVRIQRYAAERENRSIGTVTFEK